MTITPGLARAFAVVEAAAAQGLRCPTRKEAVAFHNRASELAWQGFIKVEVYARNYRVVTILVGPYAGKSTKPPSTKSATPWLTQTRESMLRDLQARPANRRERCNRKS